MDNMAERLKRDAERIEVCVSDQLQRRIDASVAAATPLQALSTPRPRSPLFWLASSLTGIAATLAIVALVNRPVDEAVPSSGGASVSPVFVAGEVPIIEWHTESAMLTEPLREELLNLQSDLEKAERQLRKDIGL